MAADIERWMGSVDARLANLEKVLLGNGQPGAIRSMEDRISRLEQYRWLIGGAVALFMTGVTVYAALVK